MNMKFHRKRMKSDFQSKWLNCSLYPAEFPELFIYYVWYLQHIKIITEGFLLYKNHADLLYFYRSWNVAKLQMSMPTHGMGKMYWLMSFCPEVM